MSDDGHIDLRHLGVRDQRRVRSAARQLRAIPTGSPPDAVFDALRVCAPVAGGLIGTMGAGTTGSVISHVVGLPGNVLEAWATTPLPHLRRMMAPLVLATPGQLISDRQAITGLFREQLSLLRVIDSAGLGESAGYKVAAGTTPFGQQEHRFVTVALEGGEIFTAAQRTVFRLLHPMVEAALSRMAVPLIPHQPILAQIVEKREVGYLCLSNELDVVEYNQRAWELACQYLSAAKIESGQGWLRCFAGRVLSETVGGRSWHLVRHDHRARIEINAYWIAKETHGAGQDLTLVELRETETSLPSAGLTSRQREVADLLVTTDLSYKEIAHHLGITVGTVRKHVEKIYRRYGVQSRAGLTALPR